MTEASSPRRAVVVVAALLLATAVAPHLAPRAPDAVLDPAASRDRPPGTILTAISLRGDRVLLADRWTAMEGGDIAIAHAQGERLIEAASLAGLPPRTERYLLGSDRLGRDLLSRLLHGWRNSLAIALTAGLLALAAGTAVGLASAYAGGMLDGWAMRSVDLLMAMPKLFLLLAVSALAQPSPTLLVLLLAGVSWMSVARITRARALALRESGFVEAARATGCSATRILWSHLLPHLGSTLVTLGLLRLSSLVLLESALSFIGAGLAPPTPTLGGLVADAALHSPPTWWMVLFPGVAITLPSLACLWAANRLTDTPGGRH